MAMERWDPFNDIVSLRDAMDRLFEQSVVHPQRMAGRQSLAGAKVMPVDLFQKGADYIIKAYVPGVKAEDVQISSERDAVTLKAHIPGEIETDEARGYRWMVDELGYGDVLRTLVMPGPIDAAKIEATVENGVLTVLVPQAEEAKPRKIQVKAK
jgi:HSP20 family protein